MNAFLFPLLIYAQVVFTPPVKIGVAGEGKIHSSATPIPFPAESERWFRVVTPRFDIVSAASEYRTREVAHELETLAAALRELQPGAHVPAPRVRIVIFGRRRDAQPYFDVLMQRGSANLGGLFIGHRDRGVMMIDGSHSINDRTPYHELIHSLIAARGGPRPPLWVEEGLAEFYSNARFERGQIAFGAPIREHIHLIQLHSPMPIQELFATRYESEASTKTIFYAESWAAIDTLLRLNRRIFPDFLADLTAGVDTDRALRKRYRIGANDLMNSVEMYANPERPEATFTVAAPEAPDVASPVALTRADVLYQLGTVLALVPGLERDAERHLRAVLAIDPKYAQALTAIGSLRLAEKKFTEADRLYKEAVEAAPDDPDVLLARAESLLRDELGPFAETNEITQEDIARFHLAREVAQTALAHGADDARAYGVIGTSYMRDADLRAGIAALEKAHDLVPSRADYAVHLFAMLRQSGPAAKSDKLFAELDSMHDPQVTFAARAVVLRLEIDRANALIRQQKLPEAAALLRALVAKSDDQRVKGDLERQAAEIESVAGVNAEIAAYNEAIALFNGHHLKEAIAKLDALLATATDTKVISDAKRLREIASKQAKR